MSYTLTFFALFGLIVLIVYLQRRAAQQAKQRAMDIANAYNARMRARKEAEAWATVPVTRMDKPTKLPTVHKRALTVPNVAAPVSKLPKRPLKPSYPPPKQAPLKPSEVVAVEPSRADNYLDGVMMGIIVDELFHSHRDSGSVISRPDPIESGGGGSFGGGGASGSWDSSSSDSSSSDSGSSDSSSSSSDN